MKVLQINTVCGTGSTGKITVDLYKILKKENYDCKISYGRGDIPITVDIIDTIKIGNEFDSYMHGLKTRVFDRHGFGSINSTKKFIKQIEEYNPDIVHLHNIHGYYINIEILFKYLKKTNRNIVWTLHDCWPFTGHCAYFDYVKCDRWKECCYDCSQKNIYPASYILENSKQNYINKKELFTSLKNVTIVTPSMWLASLVKESFLSKYPIKVINNGVDLDLFKPTESNFREKYSLEKKFIILGVANVWEKRKGLEYFIELSKLLDRRFKIVLVGIKDRKIYNIPDNILTIARTDNVRDLAGIYTSADIFLNPTLEDNFPTTNLESLACGTPVITFNTGGSIECVDNSNGYIVEKGDIESIVDILQNIDVNNYKKSNKPIYNCDISKENMVSEYLKLYNTLIN